MAPGKTVVSMPPAENTLEVAIQQLRSDVKHLMITVEELKEADKSRAQATRTMLLTLVVSFLVPVVVAVWYGGQLAAKVDYQDMRIRALEVRQ